MQKHQHPLQIITIDSFLSITQCQELINFAEDKGFSKSSIKVNIRNNKRLELEYPKLANQLWEILKIIQLPILNEQKALGLPPTVRFYKYEVQEKFKMHKDGSSQHNGLESQMTFMIYLNEDFLGGETDFREFKIIPKTGTALLFPHKTWHEGTLVKQGIKYVLRTDVLFG